MGFNNAYNAYQKTNVKTASQGHLIVLMYEAVVKNLNGALNLCPEDGKIKAQDMEKFGTLIQKAQAIITELEVSLDMEKGGEIAKNLMSLYIFFNSELTSAIINHNREKISYVQNQMNELLSAWKVASNTANQPAQPVQSALNIEG